MPLGVAVTLLGLFLLLQGCCQVGAEIGGRHIRRITAVDLPSSNSSDATKVRLKKLQIKKGENCTKAGSCSTTAAPHDNPEGKTISSFPEADVLQEGLHEDIMSYLTTPRSPYEGGYDSYFDGDDFDERTARAPKKSSFSNEHHSGTEAMNFDAPLTTPRISLFDDVHARMTEGIRQNLEDMDNHAFPELAQRHNDNVQQGHRAIAITVQPPPTDKTNDEISLEFLSKYSVVYNDSKIPFVRRDIVVENETHLDFERSRIHTEVVPEVNRTVYYISNDTHSTVIPASDIWNKTGTPDDKDSTISESTKDRSFSRSSSSEENRTVTSDMPIKLVLPNDTNTELIESDTKSPDKDTSTSSSAGAVVTKGPASNAVRPVSTASNTTRVNRILVSNRGRYNSTEVLEQSSQTPVSKSPESVFSSEEPINESRSKYHMRRTGTNRSEEQVDARTETTNVSTEKSILSSTVANALLSQTVASASSGVHNEKDQIYADGFTKEPEESSTAGYVSSSRSRAFTSRRPVTAAENKTRDNEVKNGGETSVDIPSANSSSVNVEAVDRRLSTLKRRLQTNNTTPVTSSTPNDSTTESNAIIREFPASSARISVLQNALSNKTDNNEGNDIISFKNNVHKPVTRNRGSVRYGSQRNDTLDDIPPTAAIWTLVTLRGRENRTGILRQDNSTSDTNMKRLPSAESRRPWNWQEQGSTTIAVDEEDTASTPATAKSTKLSQVTRVRGARPQKPMASSMQENRLSSVQIAAPTTDQASESTVEPTSFTESEDSSTSLSSQITTEINLDSWYKQTEPPVPGTSTVSDVSTSSDTEKTYGPYAIPPSQVTVSAMSVTTDDTVTLATESLGSTTENYEPTSVKAENTSAGLLQVVRLSTADGVSPSRDAEHGSVTSTTESLFHVTTTRRENDQQYYGKPSGEDLGTSDSTISNAEEANNQSAGNTDTKVPEGDVNRPGNGDERTEVGSLEGVYSQGDAFGGTSEDENKNTDGTHGNESSGKLPIMSGGVGETASADSDASQTTSSDFTTGLDAAGSTDVSDDAQIATSTGLVESFATPPSEQTTTWGSSTSAIEWGAESTIPSMFGVHFYLVLRINTTWLDFCNRLDEFKQSVVNLMSKNDRPVQTHQVIVPNASPTLCGSAAGMSTPDIEVEMYLEDESHTVDYQLTSDFYSFWRESGVPDFPVYVSTVEPVGQTTDEVSDDEVGGSGMIAAITISCIAAACLLLIAVLWIVMRKRQRRFNYPQRCTPVSLDAYSLDSVSVCGSARRKVGVRNSKRSYGNAGFDDPTSPSHPMGFAELANFILNRHSLEEEFARIPQVTANVDELPEGADTKNRYANVIPLPETRVHLSPREGEPLSEYINANFVHGPKNASKFYIACQAPMASTVTDFWRMIWEQQSKIIIMLTDLVENGVEKSVDYLPPSEVLDCHRLFGDFQITLKKREVKDHYIISTLQVKNLDTNSWREVMHLWYVSWPVQGVPEDVSSVITFLLEARAYMRGGPCVVHCSPGTGRTGAVIACDLCIRDFETRRTVDIPRCVAQLRRDRAGAVQTRDQYVFIYQVINLYGTKLTGGALDSM